jgi:hypothetical protein
MASLWTMPAWQNVLLGVCVCVGMMVQTRIYPLPTPDDPTNRGCLWLFHSALALSQWLGILVGGSVIALGLIRMSVGMW